MALTTADLAGLVGELTLEGEEIAQASLEQAYALCGAYLGFDPSLPANSQASVTETVPLAEDTRYVSLHTPALSIESATLDGTAITPVCHGTYVNLAERYVSGGLLVIAYRAVTNPLTTSEQAHVDQLILGVAAKIFNRLNEKAAGVDVLAADGESISFSETFGTIEKTLLSPYARHDMTAGKTW